MEVKIINHSLNGSTTTTDMKGSVQGVLQNLQAWEKDGINNFQKLYDTQNQWLMTAASSFAEKFSFHLSSQPLSSSATSSLSSLPLSTLSVTTSISDILPLPLSNNNTYHTSKMKPDKKPQLKLSAMDFTQLDDDVDDEIPTVRSKTATTLPTGTVAQDGRKRMSNTKGSIEPVQKRTSRGNEQGNKVDLYSDTENHNPSSNIRDVDSVQPSKSPLKRSKTSLLDLIAEPPSTLLSSSSSRRASGSSVSNGHLSLMTTTVDLHTREITSSNGLAHVDHSLPKSRTSTHSSSFLPEETEPHGPSFRSTTDVLPKSSTLLPTTQHSNITNSASQPLSSKQITRPRKSSTSFPSKKTPSRKSSINLGSPGNSSVDEEPGVDPYAVEVLVPAKACPLTPSYSAKERMELLLDEEPGIDPYAQTTNQVRAPLTASRVGRVDPSPRLPPAKRTQDPSPPLQAVSSLSSTSLPSPRDNVSAIEKQKQAEKVAEMRKRYLESSQLQQSKMQEARKIASMHPEPEVEDPLEPGLVSPTSALPSTDSQDSHRRFSFPSSPSLPVSPIASSQPIGFVSPQFSPISHIAESPIVPDTERKTTLGTKRALPTKATQAVAYEKVTRSEKAREEKAREERLKEAEKKQKATKEELAKQRRAEAERKRKLLEEEELRKKQLKAEERAKKMEKKNQQQQEQKKINEDKRITAKEKAETLKKPLKEDPKEETKKTTKAPATGAKRPILQPVAHQNDGLMSPPPNRPPRAKTPDNPFQLIKKRVVDSPKQNHDEDNYEMSDFRDDDDDEYSDDTPAKPIPAWAKGAMLTKALEAQYMDPDEIFHPIEAQACDLTAIFENFRKKKRFNHRSSSGNWFHDRLHWKEEQSYKLKMGFLPRA